MTFKGDEILSDSSESVTVGMKSKCPEMFRNVKARVVSVMRHVGTDIRQAGAVTAGPELCFPPKGLTLWTYSEFLGITQENQSGPAPPTSGDLSQAP